MSDREKVISLLQAVPEYKIRYALAYIQGLLADEEADDAFCEKMWENYEKDPDPEKDNGVPLEDLKKAWGLD